ncbi:MAG: hypothetical protein ACRC8W_08775 [Plesiomonas shigelloides]
MEINIEELRRELNEMIAAVGQFGCVSTSSYIGKVGNRVIKLEVLSADEVEDIEMDIIDNVQIGEIVTE